MAQANRQCSKTKKVHRPVGGVCSIIEGKTPVPRKYTSMATLIRLSRTPVEKMLNVGSPETMLSQLKGISPRMLEVNMAKRAGRLKLALAWCPIFLKRIRFLAHSSARGSNRPTDAWLRSTARNVVVDICGSTLI
jgi:hypothetical protein